MEQPIPKGELKELAPKVTIPPEIIRPFAAWFSQKFEEPLTKIENSLNLISKEPSNPYKDLTNEAIDSFTSSIPSFLKDLRESKEVKVKRYQEDPNLESYNYDFEVSTDTERTKLKPVKRTLIKPFTLNLISAFRHRLNSSITELQLITELLSDNPERTVQDQTTIILSECQRMSDVLESLAEANEIRLSVDDNGKVDIRSIKKELPPTLEKTIDVEEYLKSVKKESVLPPEIIRPIGKWLEQKLSGPNEKIRQALVSPDLANETNPAFKNYINIMREKLIDTNLFIKMLQRSKEVKLTPDASQWSLFISPIMEGTETKIHSVQTTLTRTFTQPFLNAFEDALRNRLSSFEGFSELILVRGRSDEVKAQMQKINTIATHQIKDILDYFTGADEIKIEIDDKGEVNITPIKKPIEKPLPTLEVSPSETK